MFVKICGTTNLPDAEMAVALGADALGFIFAESKRRVSAAAAAAIVGAMPPRVERVGVFTVRDVPEIVATVREAGLTAVQMHMPYERDFVGRLRAELGEGVRLWQVVGFAVDADGEDAAEREFTKLLRAAVLDPRLDTVLLDAVKGSASGGLGRAFAWWRASSIVKTARAAAEQAGTERGWRLPKLAVAGGLTAENVREAVAALRPWGVDVVSGVEASPGRKDPERLKNFMEAARAAGESFPPL